MLLLISLLSHNLIQSTVAGVWVLGLQRFSGPLPPLFLSQLLGISLVLPVIIPVMQLSWLTSQHPVLFRINLWIESFTRSGMVGLGLLALLVLGTAMIFIVQEFLPIWKMRRGRITASRTIDERLTRSFLRVSSRYAASKKNTWRIHSCLALCLEVETSTAAVSGFFRPVLLVSRKLIGELRDEELDAVVAHELAHLYYGANGMLLILWCFRSVQCLSPASLVIFRNLIEAHEQACDSLATWIMGDARALEGVLLKVHGETDSAPGEKISTARRIHALQFASRSVPISHIPGVIATIVLGGILWAIN
ncbi:MAG: hypothetical protein A2X86_02080 [Bdellovibrionales bacterium GWA2_49_15]|nr:MAG: hypothetical protein A2X86_02080 [Bdellovibrionales bacterium GWA2_49_15]